jgi:hypothetical protein
MAADKAMLFVCGEPAGAASTTRSLSRRSTNMVSSNWLTILRNQDCELFGETYVPSSHQTNEFNWPLAANFLH